MERGKYDDIFLQIAGQVGDIESLLDEFFGFLSRKTDFYVEYSSNERATMGFPPGINEKMVILLHLHHHLLTLIVILIVTLIFIIFRLLIHLKSILFDIINLK